MKQAAARWQYYIDRQHRLPRGIIGELIGRRMLRQHTPETDWTLQLLGIQPADRVLELGAGAGRGLALALRAARSGHVAGLDLSATMLRAAARRNRTALRRGRLSLLRADLARLPFGDQAFERIFSLHTFYFWPEQGAIAETLAGLLAPGGRCVITFATARTMPDGRREYWPVQYQAEALATELQRPGRYVALQEGPDSRQFNNIALVIDRMT
jgi:ubiquinone/menaquinone biosynthesis C-methylase UbiE